jgi:transposase-like protein
VKQAMRVLKHMHVEGAERAPVQELGRQALKEVLEVHMEQRIERYLGDVRRMDASDRRNGHYRRWLLTGMGAIELHVPRTRTFTLDFRVARAESQPAGEAFLNDLSRRGLTGEGVAPAVCAGGAGLLAALPPVYPQAKVQRCWAHKVRNVLDKVKRADREAVKRGLNRISKWRHRPVGQRLKCIPSTAVK